VGLLAVENAINAALGTVKETLDAGLGVTLF
jgi:hypothetical protein